MKNRRAFPPPLSPSNREVGRFLEVIAVKRIFVPILLLILVSLTRMIVYTPSGYKLDEWEAGGKSVRVPFLITSSSPVVLRTVVSPGEDDTLVVPHFFARELIVKEGGRILGRAGREDVDGFLNEPVVVHIHSGEIEIELFPGYGYVGMGVSPYVSRYEDVSRRLPMMKLLGPYLDILSVGFTISLAVLLILISTSSKYERDRFVKFGIAVMLAGLSVLDYTPFHFSISGILGDMFVIITSFASVFSPAVITWAVEGRFGKLTKVVTAAAAVLGLVAGVTQDVRVVLMLNASLLALTLVLLLRIDRVYSTSIVFPIFGLVHDIFVISFNHGFPQIAPEGVALFALSMMGVVARGYAEALEEMGRVNEELTTSNEELEAMNEELESMYQEQEELINKLENLIKLSSEIVKGAYESSNEDAFLRDLLNKAVDMIPEAKYGSISLVENGKWRFVHAVGHDINRLKEMDFRKEDFIDVRRSSRAEMIENGVYLVQRTSRKTAEGMEPRTAKEFLSATRRVSKTLIVQLRADDVFLGHLTVDIPEGSEEEFSGDSVKVFSALGNIASAFLAFRRLAKLNETFQREIILSMIHVVEMHDPYTKGHSENVAKLSRMIASAMGLNDEEISRAYWAGLVHDLGKLLVPGEILRKSSRLSEDEFSVIKMHPVWGYEVLIYSEHLRDIAVYTRHHHERWDGKGYPDGLRGDSIPLISRIISVADTWDAMRSDRAYRKALPIDAAASEMEKAAGKQLDPDVVQVFLELVRRGDAS